MRQIKPFLAGTPWVVAALLLANVAAAQTRDVESALSRQNAADAASQKQIDGLDADTRKALQQYRSALLRAEQLRLYKRQLSAQVETQKGRLKELDAALGRLEDSRAALVPLLQKMTDALEGFVAADFPFDLEARQQRLADLRATLADPEVGLSEQYRQVYAAWQAEADAGRSLAAERVSLPGSTAGQLVDVLRVGRLALYALSLDGALAWQWNAERKRFMPLPDSTVPSLQKALRVALEQTAPALLSLPATGGEAP